MVASDSPSPPSSSLWNSLKNEIFRRYEAYALESKWDTSFLGLVLVTELILCQAIIKFVPYTEIDWEAYMQEVSMWFDDGIMDYRQIRGGTGPLVYPAGFLYLFQVIRWVTNQGKDILRAQHIFAGFYLVSIALVLMMYQLVVREQVKLKIGASSAATTDDTSSRQGARRENAHFVWSWRIAMGFVCFSKRLHSIYMLRLFNDGCAMLLLYISVLFMAKYNQWHVGCVFFSLAVSIKMNILLFAPGLLLLLLQSQAHWLTGTIVCLAICGILQLILGAPFLVTFPESYLRKAFELDRVFFYKWTVNWKFLSEELFLSKPLSILLLLCHVACLIYLFVLVWPRRAQKVTGHVLFFGRQAQQLSPTYILYTMFLSNYVGIVFCRSIHYQFYSWYYPSLPMLLWISAYYPLWLRWILLVAVEFSFNVFPATPLSSLILQIAHGLVLWGCLQRPPARILSSANDKDTDVNEQGPSQGQGLVREKLQ